MWENITEPDRPQMTIRHMRIALWITEATDTHRDYVILLFYCNSGCTNALCLSCLVMLYVPYVYILCFWDGNTFYVPFSVMNCSTDTLWSL